MEGMLRVGQTAVLLTLVFFASGCWGTITVVVEPTVDVIKGKAANLPCSFPPQLQDVTVDWYIEEPGSRKLLTHSGRNAGTSLSDRATIGQDYSLSIKAVQVDDERNFTCQVKAGLSAVGEATTQLKIFQEPEKPVVAASSVPLSVQQRISSEAGVCVSMNGYPAPEITWYRNFIPLTEVKNSRKNLNIVPKVVKEASGLYTVSSTLYLLPKKEDKDAEFKCIVGYKMPNGFIGKHESNTFSLLLHYFVFQGSYFKLPCFPSLPWASTCLVPETECYDPSEEVTFELKTPGPIKEGDKVEMACVTDGNPQPMFDIRFIKEGKTMNTGSGLLTLPSVTRANSGLYICEALDFDAEVELTAKELTLTVHYLDLKMISPGPIMKRLGESVELQCKANSSDAPAIQWKMGDNVLSKNEVLALESLTFSSTGVYSCLGSIPSVPGLNAEASVTLTVSGKPNIITPTVANVLKVGDVVTLVCSAEGHPAPQFTWNQTGKEAVTVKDNKIISSISFAVTDDILESGVTCDATNEHGKDSKLFTVAIAKETPLDGTSRGIQLSVISLFLTLYTTFAVFH